MDPLTPAPDPPPDPPPGRPPGPGAGAASGPLAEVLDRARAAAAQVSVWQGELVDAVREAVAIGGICDPWPRFLAWQLGVTPGEARHLVELAERLTELPATSALLGTGERSLEVVLSIARRATPENEQALVASSSQLTGGQLQRLLRTYDEVTRPADRPEGGAAAATRAPAPSPDVAGDSAQPVAAQPADPSPDAPPAADPGASDDGRTSGAPPPPPLAPEPVAPYPSEVRWGWERGRFGVRADLAPDDGLRFEAVLEAFFNRAGDEAVAQVPEAERRARTRVDALLDLADAAAASPDSGIAADRFLTHVLVHVRPTDDGVTVERAHTAGGDPVPVWLLPELADQGPVVASIVRRGIPILDTRPQRFADAAQRRALVARDGGCVYPGCGCTRRLVAHHRVPWPDGETSLDNLVLLCRHHHRVVHREGLHIERIDGRWHVRDAPRATSAVPRVRRTRPRHTGWGERLTPFGSDVILRQWLAA